MLATINEGDVCLLLPFFAKSRKTSVCSGPTLLSLSGSSSELRSPNNNNNCNNNPITFSTLQALVRGSLVLGEAISLKCNLVVVLVLGSCCSTGSLTCVIHYTCSIPETGNVGVLGSLLTRKRKKEHAWRDAWHAALELGREFGWHAVLEWMGGTRLWSRVPTWLDGWQRLGMELGGHAFGWVARGSTV